MAKDWRYKPEPEGLGIKEWGLIVTLVLLSGFLLFCVASLVIGAL
ncbi:hypothetical protein FHY35_004049 [Xanthomonas arboricola]|nr:hypothetical protein [Xanthomonas arboricola]